MPGDVHYTLQQLADKFIMSQSFTVDGLAYELVLHAPADPSSEIPPAFYGLRFSNVVDVSICSNIDDALWQELIQSSEDRESKIGAALVYPEPVVTSSKRSTEWSRRVGTPFFEYLIQTSSQDIVVVATGYYIGEVSPPHISD